MHAGSSLSSWGSGPRKTDNASHFWDQARQTGMPTASRTTNLSDVAPEHTTVLAHRLCSSAPKGSSERFPAQPRHGSRSLRVKVSWKCNPCAALWDGHLSRRSRWAGETRRELRLWGVEEQKHPLPHMLTLSPSTSVYLVVVNFPFGLGVGAEVGV